MVVIALNELIMKKNNKKNIAILIAMFFLLTLDRFLKILSYQNKHNPIIIIKNWFNFNFAANKFIAFSLPLFNDWALKFLIITIIIILTVWLISNWQQKNYLLSFLLLFILIGAISNLWDRLTYGFVIDYFDVPFFTVFNLADAMIVLGVFGILILTIHKNKP